MKDVQFPYKPRLLIFFLVMVFFGVGTFVLVHIASTNDRGLILYHLIEFSKDGATIFYWILSVLSGAFSVVGLVATLLGIISDKQLIITDTFISVPQGHFKKGNIEIAFAHIQDINMQQVQNEEFLNILHSEGKTTISKSMLPSKKVFDEVVSLISERTYSR